MRLFIGFEWTCYTYSPWTFLNSQPTGGNDLNIKNEIRK